MEKTVKRKILGRAFPVEILFGKGQADLCEAELQGILSSLDRPVKALEMTRAGAGIHLASLDLRQMLELTYRLKTARDLLWTLAEARAGSLGECKRLFDKVPWSLILPEAAPVSVRVNCRSSRLYHETMVREHFEESFASLGFVPERGQDEDEGKEFPFVVDVRIDQNRLRIALSLGGAPLYRRGYKAVLRAAAPIKEDLAAGVIYWTSRWLAGIAGGDFRPALLEAPFAGSGTLGFEAALYWLNAPVFVCGRSYAVDRFLCTPSETRNYLRRRLIAQVTPAALQTLRFQEIDPEQAKALAANAEFFGRALSETLPLTIQVHVENCLTAARDDDKIPTFVAMNPPYGDRMLAKRDALKQYAQIGALLSRRRNLGGFVLVPDDECLEKLSRPMREAGFSLAQNTLQHGGRTVLVLAFFRAASPVSA